MVIKNGLVISTENVKIISCIVNVPCILKNKICYTDKDSLIRVKSFTDDIISQCDIKLPTLITYK